MNLTNDQLHTLRHMLGINTPGDKEPKPYRNYAAVVPGDSEYLELERLGAVECYRRANEGFSYDYYRCTEAGRAAAMESHRKIRYTRSKRVYGRFLSISDGRELTFKEFLTAPEYAEARRNA